MSFSLNGLASGLDTGTIITQLMQIERIPYQKLESKQVSINSELAIFRSINTKLITLRTAAEDLLLKSNFNVRSASNSDETVLKASVSEDVVESTYHINVTQLASQHIVKSKQLEASDTLAGTIKINGFKFILVNSDDPQPTPGENEEVLIIEPGMNNDEVLTQLMNSINGKNLGAKASIIETEPGKKTLVFTSEKYGEANKISFEDSGFLNLNEISGSGKNAELTVNGINIRASSNELNNVVSGLSLTLTKTGETTITVSKDADKIAEKVEAFVKAYNDVISTIKSNTAKGKDLQGDSTLRSLENHLSSMFNRGVGEVEESLKYLYDIGLEIDRGKTSASEMTGTISFDKEKFKSALAENPEEVYNLFALDNSPIKHNGIAQMFKESLMDWTRSGTGIITSRIDGYNDEISFLKRQMEDMTSRLDMKEAQLRRQFTAMESALAQLQNQQAWMASQIASMGIY